MNIKKTNLTYIVFYLFFAFSVNAQLNASYFGFDSKASNNIEAMRNLEAYANSQGNVHVDFDPGTYTIKFPSNESVLRSACEIKNASKIIINASKAYFYSSYNESSGRAIFSFKNSKNITLNANFKGEHKGDKYSTINILIILRRIFYHIQGA